MIMITQTLTKDQIIALATTFQNELNPHVRVKMEQLIGNGAVQGFHDHDFVNLMALSNHSTQQTAIKVAATNYLKNKH